jgi:hypothetical protein
MEVYYLEFLRVYEYDNKIRFGNKYDGGYVVGELLDNAYDCYISAGVSTEESFTRDFLNKYKIPKKDCYAFDGTIENYPKGYSENIQFIKKNINSFNSDNNTNLEDIFEKYRNIFVKMDIEGYEYPWILSMSNEHLKKIKQCVIEFHGAGDNSWKWEHSDKVKCWMKMNKTHFLIHTHGNNYGSCKNGIPETLELTYMNYNEFNNIPSFNKRYLPIDNLDYPNYTKKPDYNLCFYPFVYNAKMIGSHIVKDVALTHQDHF